MAKDNPSNKRSPSTTSEWQYAKIRRRPTGQQHAPEAALSALRPSDNVTLTVRYLGGSEAWLEIRSRGRVIKVPGHRCIFDVMTGLWGQVPR